MLHVSGHKGSAWKNDTKHLCQFSCFNTNTCTDVKRYYNETTSRFAGNRLLYILYLMQETLLLMLNIHKRNFISDAVALITKYGRELNEKMSI